MKATEKELHGVKRSFDVNSKIRETIILNKIIKTDNVYNTIYSTSQAHMFRIYVDLKNLGA